MPSSIPGLCPAHAQHTLPTPHASLQPDRPAVCAFWVLALLSCFSPRSGTNEEGLQVVCLHLARHVFLYTGHAVPAPLRHPLARTIEAHRIRLEVTRVTLAAPLARRYGPVEDRISAECTQAAVRVLQWVLQTDAALADAVKADMRAIELSSALREQVRVQLACALLLGRNHDLQRYGFAHLRELRMAEVAKLVVATGVRGSGLVSTAFGWLVAPGHCQQLLARWTDPAWWQRSDSDDLIVALNASFSAQKEERAALGALDPVLRCRYGRAKSFGHVRTRSAVASSEGFHTMHDLLNRLAPLEAGGRAGALAVPMLLLPPEMHDWCDWVYQAGKAGKVLGFRPGEAGFMQAAGGPAAELIRAFERGDLIYDIWRSHVRHIVDVQPT